MRLLVIRLLALSLLLLPSSLFAHNVTISGTHSFASLDGSSNDHDGAANGVFTVNDGDLVVNGVVNCNDDGGGDSACSMAFAVSGNLTIASGGALFAENRTGGGIGGAITLTAGGDLVMTGNAIVSTASKSSSGSTGGAITANAGGDINLAFGTTIDSGSANARGGNIILAAAGLTAVDGNVLSGPSRTLLATRLGGGAALDGGSSNVIGGAISITSTTFAEPAVTVGASANIVSQGADGGAGPVTLDGCGIQVRGLVAALSRKAGTAQVNIRSGKDVLVDGRDLGAASGTRMGRVRADAPTGTAANKGIDIFASETIDIFGPSGSSYVLTSLPGLHDTKSYGGLIRITSLGDTVNASGNVIDDGHSASGDTGGTVEIAAKGNVNLDTAVIRAHGDFNTNNNNRGGGIVRVRSYSGDVIWTNGVGEVRPVGSTSGLALADQGSITLTACGTVNTTGSTFPVMGVATSPLPQTQTGVCSPAAPSLPIGVPALITCNTPPVANDATASTNEDTTVTITLSGSDADGDSLTFSIVSGPSNGTLGAIISTGPTTATVDYTPGLNYFGSDSFVFRANDGNGGTDDATATITIAPVNDPPTFLAGPTVTVLEDSGAQSIAGWVSGITAGPANETGQTVSFTVTANDPSLFSVQPQVAPNGTLTFTPATNAFGSATLTIVAKDNGGTANGGNDTAAPQTSSITVTPVNDEPSFTAGANQTVNEDAGPQTVSPWATALSAGPGEAGQTLTFVVTNGNNAFFSTQPAVAANGTLTYTTAAHANGSVTVTVFVKDDGGTANGGDDTSAPQTFTITVNAVNDAPSFTSGGDVTVFEDSGSYSAAWASAISAGPADENGQSVSFSVSNNNNSLFATQPAISPAGVLTFVPATNAFGNATVTVTLSDNGGTANGGDDTSASQTFTITIDPVNDEPTFTAGGDVSVLEDSGTYSAAWATSISAGPNEGSQTVAFAVTNDNNGLFSTQPSISAAGLLSFVPAADAFGSAVVSVTLSDNGGTANGGDDTSATVTFTITVDGVNDAPSFTSGGNVTVNEDSGAYSAAWATAISAGPANESSQTVTFNLISNSNSSLFAVAPSINSAGLLSFTVAANASGTATIVVNAQDNGGIANGGADTSANVTFTITVNGVNDAPSFVAGGNVAVAEDSGAYSAAWATSISAGPGEAGQTLTFNVSNNSNGLFAVQPSISATGVLTFTPAPNQFGTATVTVSLSDNGGTANGGVDTSASVTFTITVNGVNDPPTAGNDAWQTFGNTEIRVDLGAAIATPAVYDTTASGTGVLDNDADNVEGDPFTITSIVGCADTTAPFDCTLAGGTKLSMNANGSFTLTPGPGSTSASFQYVVTDQPAAGVPASATGTVTFTLFESIWYVNPNAASGGTGVSNAPFNSFGSLNSAGDVDDASDYIFVHNGTVNGHIVLESGQKLWGEGIGLTLPHNLNGNGTPTTLVAAGAKPSIIAGGVNTVTVSSVSGTEVAGLNLASMGGSAIYVQSSAAQPAGVNIYSNAISMAAAHGVSIATNTMAASVIVNDTTIAVTGNGIYADAASGTLILGLTNVSIEAVGSGVWGQALAGATLKVVSLSNVAVSGNTSGDGIRLAGATFDSDSSSSTFQTVNASASIGVAGNPVGGAGVVITNASGDLAFSSLPVFAGTSGVTLTGTALYIPNTAGFRVTSAGGSISAPAGAGLTVANATIGAANLTFTSITAAGAVNGILLDNTGTSGGLKVLGTGAAATGGTIQNMSGDGVLLTSTEAVSLSWMNVTGNLGSGIRGTGVNGFVLNNSSITGNGDSAAADDSGIHFSNLSGTAIGGARPTAVNNSTISNNYESEVQVTNSAGTLADFQMNNSTVSATGAGGSHGNLVNFLALGTANMTLNVSGGTYTGNAPSTATAIHADASGGTATANVSGATFLNNNVAVNVSASLNGNITFDVHDNPSITGTRSHALNFFLSANSTGTASGKFRNNVIGTGGVANSGSTVGFGVRVQNEAANNANILISGNTIQELGSFAGINVNHGIVSSPLTGATNVTITSNTIRNVNARAIIVQQNVGKGTVCADIAGNVMTGIAGAGGDGSRIRIRQLPGGIFNVRQKAATAATDPLELDDANGSTLAQISASGTFNYNSGGCPQP